VALLTELAVVGAIAFAFASLGELILWRTMQSAPEWFEAFAIGAGVAAASLFPLSLIAGPHALRTTAAILLVSSGISIVRHARAGRPLIRTSLFLERMDRWSAFYLVLLAGAAIGFALVNWRSAYLWDGFQIWASKAQLLYVHGHLGDAAIPELQYAGSKMNYPPLVSLYEALIAVARGRFDFDQFKTVFTVFYAGTLVLTYSAARSITTRNAALGATVLLAFLPPVTSEFSIGGYADMPLGMFTAAVVAAALSESSSRSFGSPLPWLIGSLSMVKAEGGLLLIVACASVILFWAGRGIRSLPAQLALHWRGVLIVAGFGLSRKAYVAWIGIPDASFLPVTPSTIASAIDRVPEVAALALGHAWNVQHWGVFWLAAMVSAVLLSIFARPGVRALARGLLLALLAYTTIFLFTTWSIPVHIDQAYDRLLQQIAPAAAVILAAAYGQWATPPTAEAPTVPPAQAPSRRGSSRRAPEKRRRKR
jgi:hypothetical protein